MTPTVEDYITAYMQIIRAPRGEKMIHAGGRAMRVRTEGEQMLHLPNGYRFKVTTDDSGIATQVEEDDKLHAIVRPHTIRRKISVQNAAPLISAAARPRPIRTVTRPTTVRR